MRYSLLNFIVCPRCHADLTCVTVSEAECRLAPLGLKPGDRVSPGAGVGPVPVSSPPTALSDALAKLALAPAPPDRNYEVVVDTGVLTCGGCGAWYPIIACIPEILPDHLRDSARDRQWLDSIAPALPPELVSLWSGFELKSASDAGAHHKLAEIALPSKITDDAFWGPGYASPFNLWTPEHTWHLIRNFVLAEPLLELSRGDVVLDVGSGYSWTTEWFLRSGYEPIGMDICRAYLEIATRRSGLNRPHLLVGDAECLPIRSRSIQAVLGFEAFHHIPNRPAAMHEFSRVLLDGRPVVLVEPGGAHEHAAVSIEAMERYGTLEKGMDLKDVVAYVAGLDLGDCQQHFMQRTAAGIESPDPAAPPVPPAPLTANNVYTLRNRIKSAPPDEGAGLA
ncbi:MAG TPA: methyltransferase domain-containing protein [Vicinamibacterales bacterium]|nr:methyltransferase domain-containing protein [Vicinamibacterales bacterium]